MVSGADRYGIDLSIENSMVESLLSVDPTDVDPPQKLTFAKNVFIPLTTACRYTCTYCTYFDPPGEESLLSLDEVSEIVQMGADAGCTEALFTFGDDPGDRYQSLYSQLDDWGYDSIHSYLSAACEVALEEGLLPHSNPGDQTKAEMALIADSNPSMGVMLETTADVDAHAGPRQKNPGQRLHTIRTAGELSIPFTTGILVGIGESVRDRAESILAIKELHDRYGHIQEIIIQPVVENDRWSGGTPSLSELRNVVAMARFALPAEIAIQVPPNLAPVRELIDCGINDLGGVSPITTDHINPDYAWPALTELHDIAEEAALPLEERLPVHARFLQDDSWISPRVQRIITEEFPEYLDSNRSNHPPNRH